MKPKQKHLLPYQTLLSILRFQRRRGVIPSSLLPEEEIDQAQLFFLAFSRIYRFFLDRRFFLSLPFLVGRSFCRGSSSEG